MHEAVETCQLRHFELWILFSIVHPLQVLTNQHDNPPLEKVTGPTAT